VKNFKLQSQHYFKLIFLDQYGIQHINKINEFLGKGKDILIFIASGHWRRFLEEDGFWQFSKEFEISKDDFKDKSSYETQREIIQADLSLCI